MDSLSKLVELTAPGGAKYLIVSGKESRLRTNYNPPLECESTRVGYEIALLRVETYFSFPNVDESNNGVISRYRLDVMTLTLLMMSCKVS